jgi:pyrimidine operon attenuation protein/uracil phosphoribosyltransferase
LSYFEAAKDAAQHRIWTFYEAGLFDKFKTRDNRMSNIHMVLDAKDVERILQKMTDQILEDHKQMDKLALIGIHTRGVFLAHRIRSLIKESTGIELNTGTVDINLYRDDWTRIGAQPVVRKSDISFNIDENKIILIDDVLFTGRTIRAAMDALMDFGRPARIELAVFIDRGHRELPIHANYIGQTVKTALKEAINVLLKEIDEVDRVDILPVN